MPDDPAIRHDGVSAAPASLGDRAQNVLFRAPRRPNRVHVEPVRLPLVQPADDFMGPAGANCWSTRLVVQATPTIITQPLIPALSPGKAEKPKPATRDPLKLFPQGLRFDFSNAEPML